MDIKEPLNSASFAITSIVIMSAFLLPARGCCLVSCPLKVAHFHRDNVAAAPGDVTAENEEEEKGDRGGMEV